MQSSKISPPIGALKAAAPHVRLVPKGSFGVAIAVVIWLVVVCGATILMTRYSGTPGIDGPAPAFWPKESTLKLDTNTPTLLMFIHPHCPCTRATLGELDALLAQISKPLSVQLLFVKPAHTPPDWANTDLLREASSIRGVKIHIDTGGIEARRFRAQTSGQTLLYASDGELKFQGGITVARGHAGDNPGRAAIRKLVQEGHSDQINNPAFGCGLFDAQCQNGEHLCKP